MFILLNCLIVRYLVVVHSCKTSDAMGINNTLRYSQLESVYTKEAYSSALVDNSSSKTNRHRSIITHMNFLC